MTFTIKIKVDDASEEFINSSRGKMAYAAKAGMVDVAENAKKRGRASIAANGFSSGWQQALRSVVYPKNKDSLGPAAIIFHKIPYAEVFDKPTVIQAKSARYMWIPLPNIKQVSSGRKKSITPREWIASKSELQFVKSGNRVFLVVKDKGKSNRSGLKNGTPVFVGVTSVSLSKKFNINGAAQDAANNYSSYFERRFKEETS